MIKLRAQGTKKDLKWLKKQLERFDVMDIISFSEIFSNVGTDKYYHMYIDIRRKPGKKSKMTRLHTHPAKGRDRKRTVIHWKQETKQEMPIAA